MADTPNPPAVPEDDDALFGEDKEADVLFKARMGIINLALGYWKVGVGLLGVVLLVSLVYGLWTSHVQKTQRAAHAQIAEAFEPVREAFELEDETQRDAALTQVAREVEASAESASGPAAAYGFIRAAQLYEELGDSAASAQSWKKAHEVGAGGVLGWSCAVGHATALADGGDLAGAAAILRGLATSYPGLEGAEAMAQLAGLYIDADQPDQAKTVITELTTRWPDNPRAAELSARLGDG